MLNPKLKLNPKIFNDDVEQVPIRKGFGQGLLLAGEQDKNVVGLCADLTESTQMNLFAEKFPERFVEVGVAEQNLATIASGMAAMGKIPFISSYAMFSPGRNWDDSLQQQTHKNSRLARRSFCRTRRWYTPSAGRYCFNAGGAKYGGHFSVRCDRSEKSDIGIGKNRQTGIYSPGSRKNTNHHDRRNSF